MTLQEGISALEKQIDNVVLLMEVSKNWKEFERLWNNKFGQQELPFIDMNLLEPKITPKLSEFNKSLNTALNHNPRKQDKE